MASNPDGCGGEDNDLPAVPSNNEVKLKMIAGTIAMIFGIMLPLFDFCGVLNLKRGLPIK